MCQIEVFVKEYEIEVNSLNQLQENLVKQCEISEKNIQEKNKCEVENLEKVLNVD